MSPLAWITQDDFGVGTLRTTGREVEPGVGVWNAINGFFDDDGNCFLRGCTVEDRTPVAGPLTFLWSGMLKEPAILASSATSLYDGVSNPPTPLVGTPVARPTRPAIVGSEIFLPNGVSWDGDVAPLVNQLPVPLPGMVGEVCLCSCANRLVIGQGRFIRFSSYTATGKPAPRTFAATDYHELPEGTIVKGLASIRDTLIVFTNYGIWSVTNLALDLTDDYGNPQQSLSKIVPELTLLNQAAITEWAGQIIAPCVDGCYLFNGGLSQPIPISDSVASLYQDFAGNATPGGAKVFNNHYFLPWLEIDAPVRTRTVMVFRLDRPVRGRRVYYPVTILDGHAAGMVMADYSSMFRSGPTLLVAHVDGSIHDYGDLLRPEHGIQFDANGTEPIFDLETRDYVTGNGQPNHIRELRLRYTLPDPGDGQVPSFIAALSVDWKVTGTETSDLPPGYFYDEPERIWHALYGPPAISQGLSPVKWSLPQAMRARWVRARFRSDHAPSGLIVHRLDLGVRPATHQR